MKILIIGLGSIGKKHAAIIKALQPNAEIFALRSNKSAEEYDGIQNIFSYKKIDEFKIDFAIISNPTSEHTQTILQLLDFRIPLFIEKPIDISLDIQDLIDSINEQGIITYIACNLRFLDCIKFVKEQIATKQVKKINEVNVYCGSYLPDWRPSLDYRKVYSAISELGGGVHLDLIHELDYLYWFFNMPKQINRFHKSQSSIKIASIDYSNYILEYDGFCANVILNYYRRDPKRTLELVFENETWNIDLLANTVTCKNKIIFSSKQKISDTYIDQMKYFIDCATKGSKSDNTITEAYNVLKICLTK